MFYNPKRGTLHDVITKSVLKKGTQDRKPATDETSVSPPDSLVVRIIKVFYNPKRGTLSEGHPAKSAPKRGMTLSPKSVPQRAWRGTLRTENQRLMTSYQQPCTIFP